MYLAALNTGGLSSLFGRITVMSAATILLIGIVIHFAQLRRQGLPLRHYGGILIYGAALAVVYPGISNWLSHLSTTSRGWFDILILAIASSDIIARIMNRFGGGGGGG